MIEITDKMINQVLSWDDKKTLSDLGVIIPEKNLEDYSKPYVNLERLGPQKVNIIQNGIIYTLSPAVLELFKYEVTFTYNNKEKRAFENDLYTIPFQYMNCPVKDEKLEVVDFRIIKTVENIKKLYKIIWNAYTNFWLNYIFNCKDKKTLKLLSEWKPQKFFPEVSTLLEEAIVNIK